jgi:hypothetical protein
MTDDMDNLFSGLESSGLDAQQSLSGSDLDGDATVDENIYSVDVSDDGSPAAEVVEVDLDGDGAADVSAVDADDDGQLDTAITPVDLDADGNVDLLAGTDESDALWGDVNDSVDLNPYSVFDGEYDDLSFPGFDEINDVHGTPIADMALWDQQDGENSCVMASANMAFRAQGIDIGEAQIAEICQQENIYTPQGGARLDLLDDVINKHWGDQVSAEEVHNFTPENLNDWLDKGITPIVGIDPTELYYGDESLAESLGLPPDMGHAVVPTGTFEEDGVKMVVLNDPSGIMGPGITVPLDRFMDSAEDYGCQAIAISRVA